MDCGLFFAITGSSGKSRSLTSPFMKSKYWTTIGLSYPSACRFPSMIAGVQFFPQVGGAGGGRGGGDRERQREDGDADDDEHPDDGEHPLEDVLEHGRRSPPSGSVGTR